MTETVASPSKIKVACLDFDRALFSQDLSDNCSKKSMGRSTFQGAGYFTLGLRKDGPDRSSTRLLDLNLLGRFLARRPFSQRKERGLGETIPRL